MLVTKKGLLPNTRTTTQVIPRVFGLSPQTINVIIPRRANTVIPTGMAGTNRHHTNRYGAQLDTSFTM